MLKAINHFFSSRLFHFFVLPLMILVWFVLTDPSHGEDTLLRVQLWAQALLVTGLSYLISKSLLGNASSKDLYEKSILGNRSAGLSFLGICLMRAIVLLALLLFFALLQK